MHWWRTYSEPPADIKRIVLSVDSAFKVGAENDWSVATVWAVTQTSFCLLHLWRQRVEFPVLKQKLVELCAEWNPNVVLVEDAASGQSLIQELKAGTTLPVLPIKPDRDKVSRANAVTPLIECGKVFIPESAPWKDTFLDETSSFPNSTYDDIVDSTMQALNYMRVPRKPNLGLFQWYEQELGAMGVDSEKLVA